MTSHCLLFANHGDDNEGYFLTNSENGLRTDSLISGVLTERGQLTQTAIFCLFKVTQQ